MKSNESRSDGDIVWKEFRQENVLSSLHIHLYCAYRTQLERSWNSEQACDSRARLYLIHSGSGKILHHNHTFDLMPGHLYLIPANTLHGHSCSDGLDISWCHFTALFHTGVNLFNVFEPQYELPIDNIKHAEHMFNELANDFSDNSPSSIVLRTGLLLQLLAPFFGSISTKEFEAYDKRAERFQQVLHVIENSLSIPPTVPELASQAGMSTAYFSRTFSETFKMAPARYILRRRIENTQISLLQSEDTIETIGIENGFHDGFHFSKTFKRIVGLSPGRYRTLCRTP